jgi:hypothetical protein
VSTNKDQRYAPKQLSTNLSTSVLIARSLNRNGMDVQGHSGYRKRWRILRSTYRSQTCTALILDYKTTKSGVQRDFEVISG